MWAVGVILYLLLVGRFPFKGDSDSNMMSQILSERASVPGSAHCSSDAKDLIDKILEPDVSVRPSPTEALQHKWIVEGSDMEISEQTLAQAEETVRTGVRGSVKASQV